MSIINKRIYIYTRAIYEKIIVYFLKSYYPTSFLVPLDVNPIRRNSARLLIKKNSIVRMLALSVLFITVGTKRGGISTYEGRQRNRVRPEVTSVANVCPLLM